MLSVKRRLLRSLLIGSGIAAVRWMSLRAGIYCFNFHRIGAAEDSPFDRGVFSCDEKTFQSVVEQIARRFHIISLPKAVDTFYQNAPVPKPVALLTFDDGYRDNYETAFPILRKLGLPATFFLPTRFIGHDEIPWWDQVAWIVRHAQKRSWQAPESSETWNWDPKEESFAIRRILRLIKDRREHETETLLADLAEQTEAPPPPKTLSGRLFMSWDEARDMHRAGMAIGSHTHTHRILSQLSPVEQQQELALSREIITRELDSAPLAVSYPVGGQAAFTEETQQMARQSGYLLGFSFIPGVASVQDTSLFSVPRFAVDEIHDAWSLVFRVGFGGVAL